MRRLPLLALLVCLAAGPLPAVHVTVDFAQPADYPLSKSKFGVFDSGMVRPDRYARDLPLFKTRPASPGRSRWRARAFRPAPTSP